ncbi:MAG: T9SS type A sorting domain-containing protein [Crocinitomicaceae bacterium]|nr:T9SS type A sorting domain-containing protein [Crocinitomicaceae bacterium]
MKKIYLVLLFLLPLLSQAQDWPIKGTPAWPGDQKDLNDTCDVIPLGVDFGLCQMALGWALTDSGCVVLSGCGWIGSNGIDYTSSFFSSSYECNSACLQDTVVMLNCIDSSLIDLQVFCGGALDPVCGCDSVTYQNWCRALYYHGVSSYYPGACVTSKLQAQLGSSIGVFPNPSNGLFHLAGLPIHAQIICTDLLGNAVFEMSADQKTLDIELGFLPTGCYLLTVDGILVEKLLIE